ncbi:MAG: ABC transporter ATP-binding protein [Asgard group archaeon]|nr:ABC transporter ATP-binding protein [Asgard group archaeon]
MSRDDVEEKEILMEIKNLKTYFKHKYEFDEWRILDGINLKIYRGTTLGLLGPSGSGKSVLARSILRLVDYPGKIVDGEIIYKGQKLYDLPEEELDNIRGKEISLVLQNAPGTIDPVRNMTFTTSQPYRAHSEDEMENYEIKMLVIDQLGKVSIREPTRTSDKYAHQLSGGESQRVKIASALMNNPTLLIADEPVGHLDATVAKDIIDLLAIMKEKFNLTMLLIAHSLGVLAELSDYLAILYAGKIIEYGDVDTMFYSPRHPFTQGLFYATPSMAAKGKLKPIPGVEPDPRKYPTGCRFHPRCEYAIEKCKEEEPELIEFEKDHLIACWRAKEIPDYEKAEY